MKPICVPCRRFFKIEKNGYYFLEGMPRETPALPGNAEPEKWAPYKLWCGDLWKCAGCGAQIVFGTWRAPVAEHFQGSFEQAMEKMPPQIQVNDC